jgi:hypothetical protein
VIDFRAQPHERAGARWSRLTETERRAEVRAEKHRWMAEHLGELERDQAYGAWLKAQPAAVQDAALGATRARLFREGGLAVDRFVDPAGRPLTLDELARTPARSISASRAGPGHLQGQREAAMKLRAVYTDENEIPTGFRELYEEQDGKFVLKRDAIEGVKAQADLDRVNDTLKKERKARADAEAKLKRFEALGDRDPDELLRAADEVESLRAQVGSGDAKSEEAIQKRIAGEVAKETNRSTVSWTSSRATPRRTGSAPTSWRARSAGPPWRASSRRWRPD